MPKACSVFWLCRVTTARSWPAWTRWRHRWTTRRVVLGEALGNPTVLERPIGSASLTSACAAAMRSRQRQRQFVLRDRLRELEDERASLEAHVREWT